MRADMAKNVKKTQAVKPETASQEAQTIGIAEIVGKAGELLLRWGWVLLLVFSVGLIGYYVLFPSRGYFHSDTTDTLMWGVASAESGTLFNPEFEYACLLPFSTSLLMWPLVEIFGVTMTAHVIGMLLFFLCFTGAMIWMLRKMQWSWQWISVGVTIELLMLSGSEKLREIFWGHTIYYSLGVLFIFVGLGLLFRFMDLQTKREAAAEPVERKKLNIRMIVGIALIGLWFLLTCTNQIIAIAIFALPVMAAWFCERWFDSKSELAGPRNRRALLVFLVMGIGTVAGHLLTNVLANGITAYYETSFSTFSNMDTWLANAQKFPQHWFSLLGVNVVGGTHLMSAASIQNLIVLIAAAAILILPVAALCCYSKIDDAKLRILILTFWFMTMLIMIGYICGMLSNANWRLCPIVAMAVMVSVAFLRWAVSQISMQRVVALLMIPVMAASALNALAICKMKPDHYNNNILYMLTRRLKENNLNYGYATFWRANGITVVSDSAVECRSVNITQDGISPYYYQSCRSWFEDQPGQEEYFLLMTHGEKEAMVNCGSDLVNKVTKEIETGGYYIWVFDENIF